MLASGFAGCVDWPVVASGLPPGFPVSAVLGFGAVVSLRSEAVARRLLTPDERAAGNYVVALPAAIGVSAAAWWRSGSPAITGYLALLAFALPPLSLFVALPGGSRRRRLARYIAVLGAIGVVAAVAIRLSPPGRWSPLAIAAAVVYGFASVLSFLISDGTPAEARGSGA